MKKPRLLLIVILFATSNNFGQLVDVDYLKDHANINSEMNDYCRTCHICENPTKLNPCLMECARYGAQFTGIHSFKEGPKIVIMDKLAKIYKPVIFAHELHASMSDISGGCTLCHHYSEKTGEIPSCENCHKDKSDMTKLDEPSLKGAYHRQCLGCHRDWSHDNACQFCHEESSSSDNVVSSGDKTDIVGVSHPLISAEKKYVYQTTYPEGNVVTFHHADHVNLFGLRCTDCHQGDSCSHCHDTVKSEEPKIEHLTTCGSCHNEENCGFCHSSQEKPPFNHDTSTGFFLGSYHKNVDCNKCHSSVDNFVTPSTTCTDCHIHWEVDVFDHSITGLILSENHIEEDCDVCHIDRDFSVAPTCDTCHDEISYPNEIPGERD